jgi:hypothetical protein
MIHLRQKNDVEKFDASLFLKTPIFSLVYIEDCPWCKRMMGEWLKLAANPPKGVLLMMIELPALQPLTDALKGVDARDRFGHVSTVPAIDLHRKKRRRAPFKGERVAETMRTFVEKRL